MPHKHCPIRRRHSSDVHAAGCACVWHVLVLGANRPLLQDIGQRGSAFHNSRVQSSDSNPSIPAEPYLSPAFVSQVVLANSADFQVEGQASLPQSHSRDLMLSESWLFQYPYDHVVLEFKPSLSPLPLCHGDTAWGRDQGSLWGSEAKEETIQGRCSGQHPPHNEQRPGRKSKKDGEAGRALDRSLLTVRPSPLF